jgi:hypothetical protein
MFSLPGLGQVYNGELEKGIGIYIVLFLLSNFWFFIGFYILILIPIIWIYGIYDAYTTSIKMNTHQLPYRESPTSTLIIYVIGVLVGGFIFRFLLLGLILGGSAIIGVTGIGVGSGIPSSYSESGFLNDLFPSEKINPQDLVVHVKNFNAQYSPHLMGGFANCEGQDQERSCTIITSINGYIENTGEKTYNNIKIDFNIIDKSTGNVEAKKEIKIDKMYIADSKAFEVDVSTKRYLMYDSYYNEIPRVFEYKYTVYAT